MGILGAQVEGDLSGKSAIRLQSELSTDAVSAAVGLKVALETAPKGSILTTGQIAAWVTVEKFRCWVFSSNRRCARAGRQVIPHISWRRVGRKCDSGFWRGCTERRLSTARQDALYRYKLPLETGRLFGLTTERLSESAVANTKSRCEEDIALLPNSGGSFRLSRCGSVLAGDRYPSAECGDAFPALEAYLHRGGTLAKIVQHPAATCSKRGPSTSSPTWARYCSEEQRIRRCS